MATWYRKEVGTARHRKIIKLSRRLGLTLRDTLGLVTSLWDTVCETAPDGSLENWDDEDIALACLWESEPSELIGALEHVRLLDRVGAHYEIHNWGRYNERTRATARQRKYREKQAKMTAANHRDVTVTSPNHHSDVTVTRTNNTNSTDRTDKTNRADETNHTLSKSTADAAEVDRATDSKIARDDINEVWQHYRTHHPNAAKALKSGRKEYRLIRERLGDFGADELKRAIDGYHQSAFHCGDNQHGKRYLSLELMMRDISHVQAGLEYLAGNQKDNGRPRALDPSATLGDMTGEGTV